MGCISFHHFMNTFRLGHTRSMFTVCSLSVHDIFYDMLPQYRERVFIVGLRKDLGLPPMDWHGLYFDGAGAPTPGDRGGGGSVRSILEPSSSPALAACELSATQWKAVQAHCRERGCEIGERALKLDSKAPALISSYHKDRFASQYVFEEADGSQRKLPRFLSPRECARLMGFPDSFNLGLADEREISATYRQLGNAVCPPVVQAVAARVLEALSMGPESGAIA